jgi:hypothetical protein
MEMKDSESNLRNGFSQILSHGVYNAYLKCLSVLFLDGDRTVNRPSFGLISVSVSDGIMVTVWWVCVVNLDSLITNKSAPAE